MAPAVLIKDIAQFFAYSGWRQFQLDRQFNLSPPCTQLAEMYGVASPLLENTSLLDLFDPSDQEKLRPLLAELAAEYIQTVPSLALMMQTPHNPAQPVELMLYSSPEANTQICYFGFIRLLPNTIETFLDEPRTRQVRQKNKQLETVAQLSRRIAAILDLDALLNYTVQSLSQDFDYKFISIFLMDNNEITISLKAASNINVKALSPGFISLPIDDETIVGRVAMTIESMLVGNILQSDYEPLGYLPIKPQSELAVPLVLGGQVLGVLDVQSDVPNTYHTDDLFLLQTIADQLAVAIENARLFEERDRRMAELAVFNQIGAVISGSHDLEVMLPNILGRVNALFQVEGVSLMLLENDELRFAVATGPGSENITSFTLKPGQGIAWSVVETGQTIRVDNVAIDSRHFSEIDSAIDFKTRSLLAVPVQIHGKMVGVIEAINRLDGRPFNRDDEVTLEFIASSVAVAIENARLFSETQRHIEQLAGLLEASHVINTLDLQDILDTIVHSVGTLLKAEYTVVYLADNEARQIRATASHNSSDPIIDMPLYPFNFGEGTVGWTLEHRQLLRLNDVTKDDRFIFRAPESKLITNLITIPLIVKDEAIGVLEVANKSGGEDFTGEDEALLSAFGNQAAVAIYNARLFNEVNQRLAEVSTLYTFADQMTKVMDLNQVSQSTVTILRHALDCDGCCLFLYETLDNQEVLVLKAGSGWHELASTSPAIAYLIKLAEGLTSKPQPIHIMNVQEHPLFSSSKSSKPLRSGNKQGHPELQMRSVMIVPLIVKDKLLGALSIDDSQPHVFGQSEGRLLTITAAQISTAIENIRLYDNLEQRAIELEAALEEVQETNRLKSEFVQNVSHELRTPLTFVRAYLELILEGGLGEVPSAMQEKLELISQKTYAVIRLVEDIVSLQKVESGNLSFTPVTPKELMILAIQGATASADQSEIKLITESAPDLPLVQVDIDRIGQVFDNLIGNAIKFSQPGSQIKIGAELDGDAIKFSVQDQGAGIPPEALNKVFDKFYQAARPSGARRYKGSGLGLAIVKQIIEAHQGQISVESKLNQGTTFFFWLPIYQSDSGIERE
ncbi:MAG: GAF domain-containing protein [Chloroflexi bacterium]|nr:GAF domain-containing protein [Chloroflexota bacterium]